MFDEMSVNIAHVAYETDFVALFFTTKVETRSESFSHLQSAAKHCVE